METHASDLGPDADIDPALIAAMESRVVVRKSQNYGNRKAGPGRPKGGGKVPGSGKKAGSPNLMTPDFREWLNERARPFEVLAAICMGEEIADGNTKRKPTVAERMRAAETLSRKLLPDLAASTLTGPNGAPLVLASPDVDMFTTARKLAFVLSTAALEMQNSQDAEARAAAVYKPDMRPADAFPAMPDAALVPADVPPGRDETQTVGNLTISFAERLPGGRDRFAIRDANGRVVGAAIGKDEALARAGALNMSED